MHHYDVDWARQQLLAMGATPLSWSLETKPTNFHSLVVKHLAMERELLANTILTRDGSTSMLPILVLDQAERIALDLRLLLVRACHLC